MAITAPTTITALPTAPATTDTATFDVRADALIAALPTMISQQNSNNTSAYNNAVDASASAVAATAQVVLATAQTTAATTQANNAAASAAAAASSAGATIWVSGTTYAIGNTRYSPNNSRIYRRKTAGAGTTDPSLDSTNWSLVSGDYPLVLVQANGVQMAAGMHYACPCPDTATNLLLYSEDFSNAAWNVKATTTIVANAATAPNGTVTADSLTRTATSATWADFAQTVTLTTGAVQNKTYTFSVWAWVATGTQAVTIGISDTAYITKGSSSINLTTVPTRYTFTASGFKSQAGAIGGGFTSLPLNQTVYAWGAQLEEGAYATDYIPTTTAAASAATRKNLLLYGEDQTNAVWSKTNLTTTSNSYIAPDGSLTADVLQATTTAACNNYQTATATATTVTYSLYIFKSHATAVLSFLLRNNTTLTNFDAATLTSSTGVYTGTGWTFTDVGGGWTRCSYTRSSGISYGDSLAMYVGFTGTSMTAGDNVVVWGAQLESGSIATPYIYSGATQGTAGGSANLPLNPVNGDTCRITTDYAATNFVVDTQGYGVNRKLGNLLINKPNVTLDFRFMNNAWRL